MTKIPPKPAYLNETQTHPIINWVLNGYPVRPTYDPSIISTNQPTLKYPKTTKITKIPLKPKK